MVVIFHKTTGEGNSDRGVTGGDPGQATNLVEEATGVRPHIVEDNAPGHSARKTRAQHDADGTRLLTGNERFYGRLRFPPVSNDIYVIENIWAMLKRAIEENHNVTTVDEITQLTALF